MPRSICERCGAMSQATKPGRHRTGDCRGRFINVDHLVISYPPDLGGLPADVWRREVYQRGYEHGYLGISPDRAVQTGGLHEGYPTYPAYRRGYEAGRLAATTPNHWQLYRTTVVAYVQVEREVTVWARSPLEAEDLGVAKANTGDRALVNDYRWREKTPTQFLAVQVQQVQTEVT